VNLNGCLQGNDYLDEEEEQPPRKRAGPDGECCVEKRSTQKVLKEHGMKKSAKSRVRSTNGDWGAPNLAWGAPTGIEESPYLRTRVKREGGVGGEGVRSMEFNIEATIQTEVCRWKSSSAWTGELRVEWNRIVSILAKEHRWELRSAERGNQVRNEIEDC